MALFGITFAAGDFVSLFSLFFDNLSTLLGFCGVTLYLLGNDDADGMALLEEILFERIVPACGIMLFLGNAYYTWQAIRLTKKYDHPYTAQPYGLNTAGGFPFLFGIMGPVFGNYPGTVVEKIEMAWKVTVGANFITGCINIFLGFFGELMMKYFPVAAMLVPLAGIGFTWLALNQIAWNFAYPAVGLIPVYLIFTQYYGLGRFHIAKGIYMPEALPIVIFGVIAGWTYTLIADNMSVADPVKGGAWIGGAFYEGLGEIGPYIGTALPFSIAASFTDMMCLVSSQKAGDPFPIRETMISDGIGTLIGSFLGSPFGTVVYIGHPVHKRVGAKTGYSIMNGIIYLIICTTGVVPVILSVIPAIAIGPIIFIFGLMICEECTKHIAQRHHCAIFFGLFFGVSDYIITQFTNVQFDYPVTWIKDSNVGPLAMSRGSALSCMLWVSIIVYTVDRKWIRAAVFCLIAALFAGIGLIHQEATKFNDGFYDGTQWRTFETEQKKATSAFSFMIGYLSMAGLCIIYFLLQKFFGQKDPEDPEDYGYLAAIEEAGVDDMFDTWWDPVEKKDEEPEAAKVEA